MPVDVVKGRDVTKEADPHSSALVRQCQRNEMCLDDFGIENRSDASANQLVGIRNVYRRQDVR